MQRLNQLKLLVAGNLCAENVHRHVRYACSLPVAFKHGAAADLTSLDIFTMCDFLW
jgi:hypothetical protein